MSKSISDAAGYDVVAEALATIKVPSWATTIGDWEFDIDGTATRDVVGGIRHALPSAITACAPIGEDELEVHLYQFQRSNGRGSEECIELSLPRNPWADMTSATARSLAQALIEAADELDAATVA